MTWIVCHWISMDIDEIVSVLKTDQSAIVSHKTQNGTLLVDTGAGQIHTRDWQPCLSNMKGSIPRYHPSPLLWRVWWAHKKGKFDWKPTSTSKLNTNIAVPKPVTLLFNLWLEKNGWQTQWKESLQFETYSYIQYFKRSLFRHQSKFYMGSIYCIFPVKGRNYCCLKRGRDGIKKIKSDVHSSVSSALIGGFRPRPHVSV